MYNNVSDSNGSTASEKFNKSEPALRSNTSELRIGCIMSDSDKAASIASVVGITTTELLPVSISVIYSSCQEN